MRRKTKILEAIRQGQIGGGESHVYDLVENIDKSKFNVIVISFSDGPMVSNIRKLGIKCYVIETVRPFDWGVWKKVSKIIEIEQIDMIHAHGTRALSNVFKSSKKFKIPLIYTIHGWSFHDDQSFILKSLRIISERYLTKFVNVIINVSLKNQESGKKYISNFNSKIVYYGINLKKFDYSIESYNIRNEFQIATNHTLVGYFVRLTKQKDPFTLIKAFNEIKTIENIKLLIIGDGDLKAQTLKLINEYELNSNVFIDNFRHDIPELLKEIDIYCLPSLWEGLPIGMLEAMAMKKAVIATRVDGTGEAIQNGKNGVLIETGDYKKLANEILRLHEDKKIRQDLGENAYVTVKNHFTLEGMVRQIEGIYQDLI